ncbi:MAG: ribosome small subunit-dependent GTPase A [Caldimonas sp.]
MPSSPSSADLEGRVVSGHGRHVVVEAADGSRLLCHGRGKKNEAVVGDRVRWQRSGDEGVVEAVLPRRNLLYRQDAWKTKAFAANLDQLLVVVAAEPVFSESQLARALIAAQEAAIPARIVLNKQDLPSWAAAEARLAPYAAIGVEMIGVALKKAPEQAHARLAPLLADRTTLVLGPSGAGKSTLVNLLVRDAKAQVGEISGALNTGRHTTTATHWYWIDPERRSALIDSPGFQEFGLRHIAANDLTGLMPDIARHASECRFYNCTHQHEPGCGVLAAIERGEIGDSRYRIYREILAELQG